MESNPNIVIVSCSNVQPETLINMLSQSAKINDISTENNSIFSWNIDTKYYTAEVNIRALQTDSNTDYLDDTVEAIVVHFDSNKETGLDDLIKWKTFISKHQPDIKILVADVFDTNTKISKRKAIHWCLENGFELIELNPSQHDVDEQPSEEEIIKETKGVERVIEALETHMWSNLIMKSKVNEYNSSESDTIDPANTSNIDKMLDNLMLDDEQLEFSDLFQRLHMVKESVQSLSVRERRHCAEQVVAAFWRAIGGDEDEIEDI